MEQWLTCLIQNPRIHGSNPANCKNLNLMNLVILMSPNRTKHCVYGYFLLYRRNMYGWVDRKKNRDIKNVKENAMLGLLKTGFI